MHNLPWVLTQFGFDAVESVQLVWYRSLVQFSRVHESGA